MATQKRNAAARAEGRKPGRPQLDHQAAVTLIRNGLSPSKAARQVGLGRSTLYRDLALIPNNRAEPLSVQSCRNSHATHIALAPDNQRVIILPRDTEQPS